MTSQMIIDIVLIGDKYPNAEVHGSYRPPILQQRTNLWHVI